MASAFIGRGVELALLEAVCLRAQRESRPAAAVITGSPGSGKTRLLDELRSRHPAGRRLSVVGYQTGSQVPLAAAGDLLRALVKVRGGSVYRLGIPTVTAGLPSELLLQRPDIRSAEAQLASTSPDKPAAIGP